MAVHGQFFAFAGIQGVQQRISDFLGGQVEGDLPGLDANNAREAFQRQVDCMQAGGLTTPGGRGRLTIQKVRLMHAAIRRLAPTAPTYLPEYGIPVNQEDLAGFVMFSDAFIINKKDRVMLADKLSNLFLKSPK